MGKSQSKESEEDHVDGASTMTRAIARGRVYVILRYPKSAEDFGGETMFSEDQFRYLMSELQKVNVSVGKIQPNYMSGLKGRYVVVHGYLKCFTGYSQIR